MNTKVKEAILNVIQTMMDRVMDKVLITDPFVAEKHHASKPLYAALVPDEIFKGSHFERRFVTPFGSGNLLFRWHWRIMAIVFKVRQFKEQLARRA